MVSLIRPPENWTKLEISQNNKTANNNNNDNNIIQKVSKISQ